MQLTSEPMTEILPNLFVGCEAIADKLKNDDDWFLICVKDYLPAGYSEVRNGKWIPVYRESKTENEVRVSIYNLNRINSWIQQKLREGFKVLVSCGAGIERSPLAVAYCVHKTLGISVEDAYDWLKERRPEIFNKSDALVWAMEAERCVRKKR